MSQAMVRFGIVGAGVAAETHAREIKHVNGAVLVANFARDARKAQAFSISHGIRRAYSDFTAFINDQDIDAVIIASPNGTHLEYGVSAARAGKHVVIEKPLEITEERARCVVEACRLHRRSLFVVYQRRSSKSAQLALQDIRSGKLGQILLVNMVDNQYRHPSYYKQNSWRGLKSLEGGGCIITQSTHLIDLAQYLIGPISRVAARTRRSFHDIETEDSAAALFEFTNGAFGTLTSSTAAFPGLRHMLTISGTLGSIILNGEFDQIIYRKTTNQKGDIEEIPTDFSFSDPTDPRDYPTWGQRVQLQEIVNSILDEVPQAVNDESFLLAARVVDAIYEAARTGNFVNVPLSTSS